MLLKNRKERAHANDVGKNRGRKSHHDSSLALYKVA